MTIRGNLEEAALPDFLQLLALGRKTGRLSVSDRSHLGYIYLEEGRIVSATLVNRPDRLGDILVKQGEITAEQLERAIARQATDRDRKVGAILVESGDITRDVLERFVRRQIEEAIYFLLTWQRGEIVFERDVAPDSDEILVSIDPDRILLEGARRTDEWTVIEKEIPSLDAVFVLDEARLAAADLPRTESLNRIIEHLDGTRNANQIIDDTGLSPFEVGKALYDLVTAGCAQPKRRVSGESARAAAEADPDGDGHLDFAMLEAYLAHAGAFADEASRKRAAQHIVDCTTCTARLSKVHLRRTGSAPAATSDPPPAATPAPKAPPRPSATGTVSVPASAPDDRGQHLRDAEMMRYVRREGEFAREDVRRDAGRHIADCRDCAARVRKMQRASQEMKAVDRSSLSEVPTVTAPALAARADHLDAGELRRYAAREGEFTDKTRRKEAGLHIADCRECAERLKALDRERKSVTGVRRPEAAAAPPPPPRSSVPAAPPPPPAPTPAPAAESVTEPGAGEVPQPVTARHLNYARLRAYAERTSEYADDEARRYARRHIMDCEKCTAALRKVRRDLREAGGSSAHRAEVERRHREDRRRTERRRRRRRAAEDRRVADRPRHPDRRVMFRRVQSDRRIADRRSLSRRTAPDLTTPAPAERGSVGRPSTSGAPPRSVPRPAAAAEHRPAAQGASSPEASTPPVSRETVAPPLAPTPPVPSPPAPEPAVPAAAETPPPTPSGAPETTEVVAAESMPPRSERETGVDAPAPGAEAPPGGRPKKLEELVGEPIAAGVSEPEPTRPREPATVGIPETAPTPTPAAPARRARPGGTAPARPSARGRRIAAVIAVMAMAGAAGWFGRAVFSGGGRVDAAARPGADPAGAETVAADPAPAAPVPAAAVDSAPSLPAPAEPPPQVAAANPDTDLVSPASDTTPTEPVVVARDTAIAAEPVAERPARTAEDPPPARPDPPVVDDPPAADPAPAPAPTVAFVSGVVRDPSGEPLADARVRLEDHDLEMRTGITGAYRFERVPPGPGTLTVELAGFVPAQETVRVEAGDSALVDLMLRPVPRPRAREADPELASGQWEVSDRSAAETLIGTAVPVIDGLWVETIATSTGRRPRVRVTQLTEDGERVALVMSRPRPQEPVGPPRVTGLRVIPGTAAYPVTTGTASFGSLLVTAKTSLPADALQDLLGRLTVDPQP